MKNYIVSILVLLSSSLCVAAADINGLVSKLIENAKWDLDETQKLALIKKFESLNKEVERKFRQEGGRYSAEKHAEQIKEVMWKYLINEQGKVVNPDTEIKDIANSLAGIKSTNTSLTPVSEPQAQSSQGSTFNLLNDNSFTSKLNASTEFDNRLKEMLRNNPEEIDTIIAKEISLLDHQKNLDLLSGSETTKDLLASLRERIKTNIIEFLAQRNSGKILVPESSELLDKTTAEMLTKIVGNITKKEHGAKVNETDASISNKAVQKSNSSSCNIHMAEQAFGLTGENLLAALRSQYRESQQRILNEDKNTNIRLVLFNYLVMNRSDSLNSTMSLNNLSYADPQATRGPLADIAQCIKKFGIEGEKSEAQEETLRKYRINYNRQDRTASVN